MAAFQSSLVPLSSSTTFITTSLAPPKTSNFATINDQLGCFIQCPHQSKSPCLSFHHVRAVVDEKYVYPDPIPEFAVYVTNKFREELKRRLYKQDRETFGNDFDRVVETCTQLFSEFVHKEYGGPGTLVVEPFTNMLIELKQRKLPGANLAARASLLWAQNYLDDEWQSWNDKHM
uniref:protein PLASTID REDOX INSENSITIVE 2, chloroplastic-like n=1 Tax=Erigeron canadensis TaxID=72917 RepID=UPI001CB8A006|nr:protein PLASTID REDOX INSENSITIVE 2, chloroplastic-like [Erigeron canadensis]